MKPILNSIKLPVNNTEVVEIQQLKENVKTLIKLRKQPHRWFIRPFSQYKNTLFN